MPSGKILLSLLLGLARLLAQPAIVAGPKVTNVSHSSARVVWITSAQPTSSEIEWGLTTSYGKTRAARAYNASPYTSTALLSGLTPNTTYHCRARLNGGAVVSGDVTFTTASEPSPHPQAPLAPSAVDVSMPVINGNTYQVLPDCSNLPSVLATIAGLTSSANHEIVIPAGTVCYSNWTFPPRPAHTGWVVVRSSAAGTSAFPPEGVRWTKNWPTSTTLAKFVTRALGVVGKGVPEPLSSASCWESDYGEGALYYATGIPTERFPIVRCSDSYPAYNGDPSIDAMTGSYPVTITATGHGLEEGQIIYLPPNGYVYPQKYYVYDVTPNTFKIFTGGSGSYTGGVSFTAYPQYRLPAHTKSTSNPSGACTEEHWWYNTTSGRQWWCVQGAWVEFEGVAIGDEKAVVALNVTGSRYRFIGLEVTMQQVPGAPDSYPSGWATPAASTNRQGYLPTLINSEGSELIWDRCYIHGQPKPARLHKGFSLRGDRTAILESYLEDFQEWRTGGYWEPGGAMAIHHFQGGPVLVRNNHLECAGITYFTSNPENDGTPVTHDVTLLRNTFRKRPEWRRTGSQPFQYPNRHAWELKQGQRYRLEGNRFDYNWSGILAGAFLVATPRCPYTLRPALSISTWNGNVVQLSGPGYFYAGDVIYISGTDPAHNGLWEVAGNGCPTNCTQITLAGDPAGAGSGGTAQLRASVQGVTDLDILHNSFYQGTEIFRFAGADPDCSYFWLPQTKRVRLHNNLMVDMNIRRYSDGGRMDLGGLYADYGDLGARFTFLTTGDAQDLILTHNTVYGSRGNAPTLLVSAEVSEGLLLNDNAHTFDEAGLTAIRGGSAYGTTSLNERFQRDGAPYWTSTQNVMCCGKGSYAGSYPAGYQWPNLEADVKWLNPTMNPGYNFRLRHDSPYISGGAQRGSDGLDVGVDVDALEAAQGRVGNVRVHSLGYTSATISYLAPDAQACTVEVGPSALWGTGTRLADGGGDRARNVLVSGLASQTLYYYRVLCAAEQPSGSFFTP